MFAELVLVLAQWFTGSFWLLDDDQRALALFNRERDLNVNSSSAESPFVRSLPSQHDKFKSTQFYLILATTILMPHSFSLSLKQRSVYGVKLLRIPSGELLSWIIAKFSNSFSLIAWSGVIWGATKNSPQFVSFLAYHKSNFTVTQDITQTCTARGVYTWCRIFLTDYG